jgi:cardiolipin synthase
MTLVWGLLIAGAVVASALASAHAVMYKRDVRAATGWAGFVWIAPYAGPLLYLLFGVNRIRRHAADLRANIRRQRRVRPPVAGCAVARNPFTRVGDRLLPTPVVGGNEIAIHATGESAFAAMLAAIDGAQTSIALTMYIFDLDATGQSVLAALERAAQRGVRVRVLVDAVGSRAGGERIVRRLNAAHARAALFLPPRVPGMRSINLRSHRKLLVIDGVRAFTGGMNVGDAYARAKSANAIRDTQFEVRGPILQDLVETFAVDWQFTTGESLDGDSWFPHLESIGDTSARVVADGPDESFELARWILLGAISGSRRRLRIVTPYFIPDSVLLTALGIAALRGVDVEIFIPEVLDHAFVKWASNATLWQVLERGCKVWFTPPPFDHSKIFTVDGVWSFTGSSNWDSRSLRLNFELNVETFDATFTRSLDAVIDMRKGTARPVTLAEMDARPIPVRLRDGIARLFSPYL